MVTFALLLLYVQLGDIVVSDQKLASAVKAQLLVLPPENMSKRFETYLAKLKVSFGLVDLVL